MKPKLKNFYLKFKNNQYFKEMKWSMKSIIMIKNEWFFIYIKFKNTNDSQILFNKVNKITIKLVHSIFSRNVV